MASSHRTDCGIRRGTEGPLPVPSDDVPAVAGRPDQARLIYGLSGERRLTEIELSWLPGFESSRPVRIGNAAYGHASSTVCRRLRHDFGHHVPATVFRYSDLAQGGLDGQPHSHQQQPQQNRGDQSRALATGLIWQPPRAQQQYEHQPSAGDSGRTVHRSSRPCAATCPRLPSWC